MVDTRVLNAQLATDQRVDRRHRLVCEGFCFFCWGWNWLCYKGGVFFGPADAVKGAENEDFARGTRLRREPLHSHPAAATYRLRCSVADTIQFWPRSIRRWMYRRLRTPRNPPTWSDCLCVSKPGQASFWLWLNELNRAIPISSWSWVATTRPVPPNRFSPTIRKSTSSRFMREKERSSKSPMPCRTCGNVCPKSPASPIETDNECVSQSRVRYWRTWTHCHFPTGAAPFSGSRACRPAI